jgi:hypothetical protein
MPKVPYEVTKESYVLRATFFYEKLHSSGFFGLYQELKQFASLHKKSLAWDLRDTWGISKDSWETINESGIEPLLVFAHPNILRLRPDAIKYYRCISLLPQKGFQAISKFNGINGVESNGKRISEDKIPAVVNTINELMSVLINLASSLNENQLEGMMYATAGTTIDGSWRNSIGAEGERVVRSLLLKSLLENKEVVSFTHKNNASSKIAQWKGKDPIAEIHTIKSIEVSNGSMVIFGSEPDIKMVDPNGIVTGGVEIKAGLDPAGALERLGAMFKSFEELKQAHPSAETILVASCITDEVDSRIKESKSVSRTYILTEVINNKRNSSVKLTNSIRSLLGLIDKRM